MLGKSSWDAVIKGMAPQQIAVFDADLTARRSFREMRVLQADSKGVTHYLNINGMPIYNDDGQFCGYRGTAHDISRQVAAEAESLQ